MVRRTLMRVGLAGVLAGVWLASPCRVAVVRGGSMEPTMHNGQVVLVDRGFYRDHAPQAGDIVIFRHEGRNYIKRVYAAEGEMIYWIAEGKIGRRTLMTPIKPAYAARVQTALGRNREIGVHHFRIPKGTFFALGDAFENSIDSRELGPIQNDAVIGRVLPWSGMPPAPDPELAPPCGEKAPVTTVEQQAPAGSRETVLL